MHVRESPCSSKSAARLSDLAPRFLLYAEVELEFAAQSIVKYRDSLRQVERIIGDRPVNNYVRDDILQLKSVMRARTLSVSRQVSILSAFKRFLQYCQEREGLRVLDPAEVQVPKRPRRDVVYLTPEEVACFIDSIPLNTLAGAPSVNGMRFRALVEALLGSAARIGELLALNRSDLDVRFREAKVIGKGGKQRVLFFTERAVSWIHRYLDLRTDDHPALFVCQDGESRWSRDDIWRPFARYRRLSGVSKRITPHLLRHTAATQLLFNGCPIGHIKEILGHERLETTCRYYLGLDRRAAKRAHDRYLTYSAS